MGTYTCNLRVALPLQPWLWVLALFSAEAALTWALKLLETHFQAWGKLVYMNSQLQMCSAQLLDLKSYHTASPDIEQGESQWNSDGKQNNQQFQQIKAHLARNRKRPKLGILVVFCLFAFVLLYFVGVFFPLKMLLIKKWSWAIWNICLLTRTGLCEMETGRQPQDMVLMQISERQRRQYQ